MTRVKICGVRDAETAREAVKAGADFIGLMFAESRRQVTPQQCYEIIEAVRETRRSPEVARIEGPARDEVRGASWFGAWNEAIDDALARWRPLLVGVFADQEVEDANEIAEAAGLELIQLSGGEDDWFVRQVRPPVMRVVHVHPETTSDDVIDAATPGVAAGVMLDTGTEDRAGRHRRTVRLGGGDGGCPAAATDARGRPLARQRGPTPWARSTRGPWMSPAAWRPTV